MTELLASIAPFIIFALAIYLFIRLITSSIKGILKFVLHALLGFLLMIALNLLGIPVYITWFKLIIAGIFGVPGVLIMVLLTFVL